MQYVLSLLSCRSDITSPCARSLLSTSSPVLTLNNATFPDSCPVKIMLGCAVNAQTVAFDPMGWNIYLGSLDSARKMRKVWHAMTILHTVVAVLGINVKNANCTLMTHPLLSDADDLVSFFIERYPFYCCRELPGEETFPIRHLPQS